MRVVVCVGHRHVVICHNNDGRPQLPSLEDVETLLPKGHELLKVSTTIGDVLTVSLDDWKDVGELRSVEYRPLFASMDKGEFSAIGKAREIVYWDSQSHFCGCCGDKMTRVNDISKRCPACGVEVYPHVSPAIIVRVTRGEEILLVHAHNFRGTHYGLVAGFLETGETLEECVRRELQEEVGIHVANVKYFDSQSWPFPSGVMVGFTAEWESGEITIQREELGDAAWFSRDTLPGLPDKLSIARRLIDDWVERGK